MTLTEFLLARIAEDEERARFVWAQLDEWAKRQRFETWRLSWHDEYDLLCIDPSRAIAECEAKRRLIARFPVGGNSYGAEVLGLLASVYSDHPDYDPAWAPE